jgi:hypothetical protein
MAVKPWKIGKTGRVDGARAKVRAEIDGDGKLPAAEKQYFLSKIDSFPEHHNWITIIAFGSHTMNTSDAVIEVGDIHIESSRENI